MPEGSLTTPTNFALWLLPAIDHSARLQKRINQLAQLHQTTTFAPHVTLLPPADFDSADFLTLAASLACVTPTFNLLPCSLYHGNTFFRFLALRLPLSTDLNAMHTRANTGTETNNEPYLPHLSLMYADPNLHTYERIVQQTSFDFREITIDRIAVVDVTGPPSQWKQHRVFPLLPTARRY